jgi:two-component system sensor histidine kinase CiaH
MFTQASLRLTAWYVAILMVLSLTFSTWVYIETTHEVRSTLNAQASHPLARLLPNPDVAEYLEQQYNESRARILGSLVLLNVGVLVAGSFMSYFLARRTLKPIEDALDAQNRFTADASHELRTPLTTMKTEIEVALRNKTLPANEARSLLQSNVEEIDRLSKLAEGLLILARTGDKPALQKVAVHEVLEKAVKRFEPLAALKRITMQRHVKAQYAQADESHVDGILGILLDNAIKYSPEKSTISLDLRRQDGSVCLTVHNTGPGIPADDLPHIFDRFYRADSARATDGYGLGLSIAHKLATNMNGTIAVKSAKGGTTFTVRLSPSAKTK